MGINILTRFYEPALKTLVDGGFPVQDAANVFSILYRLTIGSVISTRANHYNPWEARESVERYGAENVPILVQVDFAVDRSDIRLAFRDTLRMLIADLATHANLASD